MSSSIFFGLCALGACPSPPARVSGWEPAGAAHVGFEHSDGGGPLYGHGWFHSLSVKARKQRDVLAAISRYLEERSLAYGGVGIQRSQGGMGSHLILKNTRREGSRLPSSMRHHNLKNSSRSLAPLEAASIGIACMCKAGTDAPSFGEFLTLPEQKECLSCPPSNHTSIGAHLRAVLCPLARAEDRSSARLSQAAYPRQSGLREVGRDPSFRMCLLEDR
jgi:hypothetical protein